jgi:integrase
MPKKTVEQGKRIEKKVTIDGKRVSFYGHSEKEIQKKMIEYQAKQKEVEEKVARGPTFREAADQWWADEEPRLSPNSVGSYKAARNRALDYFGDTPLKEIDATQIYSWLEHLGDQGFARKTVSNHRIVISGVFRWACKKMHFDSNPALLADIPKGLKKTKRRMPSPVEIEVVQQFRNDTDGLFFFFCMYTGLRLGEALALRWKDIDAEKNVIHVSLSACYAKSNQPFFKEPKTDAGTREVAYLNRLRDVLEPHRAAPENYVFAGASAMTKSALSRMRKRYKQKTGLDDICPHQLRHAFATLCFEANVPAKTAQGLLGHAQLSTTMDIYTELRNRKLSEAAEALNNIDF